MIQSISEIPKKLETLKKLDTECKAFGAKAFRYEVLPALSETQVQAIESQYGVRLPDEYRSFLLEVGAGGAGPSYGLFPLVEEGGEWTWDGDGAVLTGDLGIPFPHVEAWSMEDSPIWDAYPDEEDPDYDTLYDAWYEEFVEAYWHEKWTTGAICICHHGCASRAWLVVSGPERGRIWEDGRADEAGLYPSCDADGKPHTFLSWYAEWIETIEKLAMENAL